MKREGEELLRVNLKNNKEGKRKRLKIYQWAEVRIKIQKEINKKDDNEEVEEKKVG